MNKRELELYLIRNGWRDTKYAPPAAVMLHKAYLESGGSGIYEKEPFAHRRLKLLKTSLRVEYKDINKWKLIVLIYYKDLKLDPESDKLYVVKHPDNNITSRSAQNRSLYIPSTPTVIHRL